MDKQEILIEKFLEGSLSGEERIEFEQLCETDYEFKKEVDFQLSLRNSLREQDAKAFKLKLLQLEKESKKGNSIWLWRAVAACLGGLFILAMWWILQPPSTIELYQSYYVPQRNIHQPLTRTNGELNPTYEAFLEYEKENWAASLKLFRSIRENSQEEFLDLYIGNCLLNLQQFEEARENLERLSSSSDLDLQQRAFWYLALVELALDNRAGCKLYLQQVIDGQGPFAPQASDLLDQLD